MLACICRSFEGGGRSSPRAIFLYHFISAIAVTAAFAIWALADGDPDAWTWFVCAVMLHGIDSLSFLELWALADDSYSLAIMEIIDRGGSASGLALMPEAGIHRNREAELPSRCGAGYRPYPPSRRWLVRAHAHGPGRHFFRAYPASPGQCSQTRLNHVADVERDSLCDQRACPRHGRAICPARGCGADFRGGRRRRGRLLVIALLVTASAPAHLAAKLALCLCL